MATVRQRGYWTVPVAMGARRIFSKGWQIRGLGPPAWSRGGALDGICEQSPHKLTTCF